MEPKPDQHLTKQQFDALASEIRRIVGDKLKNHEDGDLERLGLQEEDTA